MDEKKAVRIPASLPVLVLQDAVLFPGAAIALQVDDDDAALARARLNSRKPLVAVVAARRDEDDQTVEGEPEEDQPHGPDEVLVELSDMGVAARIASVTEGEDSHTVVLQGLVRVRLGEIQQREPQLVASVEEVA